MADIDRLSIKIAASTGNAVKNVDRLTQSLGNLNAQLNALNSNRLISVTQAIDGFNNATSAMRSAGRSVQSVVSNLSNMGQQSAGVTEATNATQGLTDAAERAAQSVSGASRASQNLGSAGEQGASGVRSLSEATRQVAKNTASSTANIKSFGKATKSASISSKGFAKELTRIGKMLKLMITRMILRKLIEGVLDGFKNLTQYSSKFNATISLLWNDMRQLGNSVAAAVSPLLNALAPALHYIIQLAIKVINVINQLIAALTGLSTWTKAKKLSDDYGKSLEKTGQKAKEVKKTLLGFDEINQLQDNNSGGGGGGTDPKDMFEEMPIDPRILQFVEDLKGKFADLKKYWDAFVDGFKKGLGDDWKDKVKMIVNGLDRIQKSLKDIWNDPAVVSARERYFTTLASLLGSVVGTVARIGLNIGANLAQGIAASLEEKAPEIKKFLVEGFNVRAEINEKVQEFVLAIGKISDVLVGENAINATKQFTNMYLEAFMLINENAAKLGLAIVTLVTQPIIDNQGLISTTLDNIIGIVGKAAEIIQTAIKDIRDIMSQVWEDHLNPMFANLTSAISSLLEIVLDTWNTYIHPVLVELMDVIKQAWDSSIKPVVDNVINIIGIIGNLISMLMKNIIVPTIKELVDKYFPWIKEALSLLVTAIKAVLQTAGLVLKEITGKLRMFLQFFETWFTDGWDAACKELEESWAQHWQDMLDDLKNIGNSIVEFVEKMINAIVHGINSLGDAIGDKLSNISFPEWLGGGSFNIEIPHLSEVTLPRFAKGGFIEDGIFTMNQGEIAGRFNNGKSVVANNEQITNGIAQAVFNAITSANAQGGNDRYINNTIYIDDMAIARAVTKGQEKLNRRYSPTMA